VAVGVKKLSSGIKLGINSSRKLNAYTPTTRIEITVVPLKSYNTFGFEYFGTRPMEINTEDEFCLRIFKTSQNAPVLLARRGQQ